jgi:hypothetical protein
MHNTCLRCVRGAGGGHLQPTMQVPVVDSSSCRLEIYCSLSWVNAYCNLCLSVSACLWSMVLCRHWCHLGGCMSACVQLLMHTVGLLEITIIAFGVSYAQQQPVAWHYIVSLLGSLLRCCWSYNVGS